MEESELQKRQTLESTADGILAVSNMGEILYRNNKFTKMIITIEEVQMVYHVSESYPALWSSNLRS